MSGVDSNWGDGPKGGSCPLTLAAMLAVVFLVVRLIRR